jgi:nucleoside-diphosphate-sugar epimerase
VFAHQEIAMTHPPLRITVLGATGGAGRAVATELAGRGHEVTAAARSAEATDWDPGIRPLRTDLTDPASARTACAGADVVVMAAQIPYRGWATELRPLVDAAVDASAAAGARLVMVDNLYAYGSPGTPISEHTPEAATTAKGRLRRELGERLLAAHRAGAVSVSIGRFADYYGPAGDNSLVYQLGIARAVAGTTPRGFIDLDQPHTFHYLPDAARGFATLAERPEADGRIWILPAAPAITQRELLGLVNTATGRGDSIGRVTAPMLRLAGLFNADLREAAEVVEQFARPYTVDASAFEAAFGPIETTPHERAVAETVAWYRGRVPSATS